MQKCSINIARNNRIIEQTSLKEEETPSWYHSREQYARYNSVCNLNSRLFVDS